MNQGLDSLFSSRQPRITLRGNYSGYRDAGITYRFRFCDDGTYFYLAEQPGRWRLAHRGVFRVAEVSDPRRDGQKLTIARFEPQHLDLIPSDSTGAALLEERALPNTHVEEYIVSTYSTPNQWHPEQEDTSISFSIPDARTRGFATSWHLDIDKS
jgi:hypothetical protein